MKKTGIFILIVGLIYMIYPCSVYAKDFLEYHKKVKRQVPKHILEKITENAEKQYPDNDRLKKYLVDIQSKAYFRVKDYKNDGLPSQELNAIKRNAEREHPYDYGRQLLVITNKVAEYIETHK